MTDAQPLGEVAGEFAAVAVSVDHGANGARLRVEDRKTDHVGFLDALELETLAWLPEGGLHRLLDPSFLRWREASVRDPRALVEALYSALERGDAEAVEAALAPGFVAAFADGMPAGAGRHGGPHAARLAWWEIGRGFSVKAQPSEWIACDEDRLLVRGRYVGTARGGGSLDAAFMHLWTVRDGTIVALEQLTDTALWVSA